MLPRQVGGGVVGTDGTSTGVPAVSVDAAAGDPYGGRPSPSLVEPHVTWSGVRGSPFPPVSEPDSSDVATPGVSPRPQGCLPGEGGLGSGKEEGPWSRGSSGRRPDRGHGCDSGPDDVSPTGRRPPVHVGGGRFRTLPGFPASRPGPARPVPAPDGRFE